VKANRAALAAVVVIVLVAGGWWLVKRGRGGSPIDLLAGFDAAQKKPNPETFTTVDATLNGDTKKAILIQPTIGTRLTYRVHVPDSAWLSVAVGVQPEAWEKPGDGVKFLVHVSDGRGDEQLFSEHVDPFNNKNDRRWIPVMVDLSAYSGEDVDLMFNTYSSMPGRGENHDNDLALWGKPEIVIR
jgi:hypothetical protein